MGDGAQAGGIERAAQQGSDAFEGQQFPDPFPAQPPPPTPMDSMTQPGIIHTPSNDLFSRPHVMEGGWYVASDRMSWWNGVMWVPGRQPGSTDANDTSTSGSPNSPSALAPLVLFLIGLAVMAAIVFIAWQAFQAMSPPPPGF